MPTFYVVWLESVYDVPWGTSVYFGGNVRERRVAVVGHEINPNPDWPVPFNHLDVVWVIQGELPTQMSNLQNLRDNTADYARRFTPEEVRFYQVMFEPEWEKFKELTEKPHDGEIFERKKWLSAPVPRLPSKTE